jgi:hypothetical protein
LMMPSHSANITSPTTEKKTVATTVFGVSLMLFSRTATLPSLA